MQETKRQTPTIDAHISETNDGPYYPVKLHAIPRVGEFIVLWSFLDQKTKADKPRKNYEVVAVLHKVNDDGETVGDRSTAHHFVTIVVKHSSSNYFTYSPS